MSIVRCIAVLALAGWCAAATAQGWSPERNVEIVVGSAPGGSNDKTARFVEKLIRDNAAPHVAAGRMRVLAVGAPTRLSGPLADVPTWRELGLVVRVAPVWTAPRVTRSPSSARRWARLPSRAGSRCWRASALPTMRK